jgi:hypothetical protein
MPQLAEKETFSSLLEKTLLDIKRSDIIIMIGDFNAQLGDNNKDTEHIMGRHRMPCESENGQLLIEFCGNMAFLLVARFSHTEIVTR